MAILQILTAGDCLFPKGLISKIYIFDIIYIIYTNYMHDCHHLCLCLYPYWLFMIMHSSHLDLPQKPLLSRSPLSSGLMYMSQKRRCASKGRSRNPSLSSCLAEKKTGWATAEGRNGLGAMRVSCVEGIRASPGKKMENAMKMQHKGLSP